MPQWEMRRGEEESSRLSVYHRERERERESAGMLCHSVLSGSLQPHGLYNLPGSSVHGISQQEYWSGLPFPSPGDLPRSETEPRSLTSPALVGITTGLSGKMVPTVVIRRQLSQW